MSDCLIEDYHFGPIQLSLLNSVSGIHFQPELLTPFELNRYSLFKNEKRQTEYLATLQLKNHLFESEEINYKPSGVPYLKHESSPHISISHSYIYIGIISAPFPIGLDIEKIADKILRVSSKFINAQERLHFDLASPKSLTTLWTIKEVVYKAAQVEGLDFKDDIVVTPMQEGLFLADVKKEDQWFYVEITTFVKDEYIISFNTTPLVQK